MKGRIILILTMALSAVSSVFAEVVPQKQAMQLAQNFFNTMYGTVTLGNGFVRYAFPVLGEKMFDFNPESTITWNGTLMNPTLNITATDNMKANITQGGNSRLANFLVTARVTNPLDQMKVSFDLSTNDDLTIQNELQSMSPDQRQTQAMNLLIYGQYTGQGGTKGNANIGGNMLYSCLLYTSDAADE